MPALRRSASREACSQLHALLGHFCCEVALKDVKWSSKQARFQRPVSASEQAAARSEAAQPQHEFAQRRALIALVCFGADSGSSGGDSSESAGSAGAGAHTSATAMAGVKLAELVLAYEQGDRRAVFTDLKATGTSQLRMVQRPKPKPSPLRY